MKIFITILIVIAVAVPASIYGFVSINGDKIITEHCEWEVHFLKRTKEKIYEEYTGKALMEKLEEWDGRLDMTVSDCKENLVTETRYDEMNFINKSRFLLATKLLH